MVMAHSWFLILFMLSVCALPSSCDDTASQSILIQFKGYLTNAEQLMNWTVDPLNQVCFNSMTTWSGVLCRNNTIFGLRLENMSLGGTINIDLLSQLQLPLLSLSVSNNNFSGPFPSNMSKLARLRRLFLSNNSFSGEIPDDAFLGMSSLRQVELAYNMFAGRIPSSLTRVPLDTLKLQNNQFEGGIPDFWQEGLQANLSYNKLGGAIPHVLSHEDASMFAGNLDLCGAPLAPCRGGVTVGLGGAISPPDFWYKILLAIILYKMCVSQW